MRSIVTWSLIALLILATASQAALPGISVSSAQMDEGDSALTPLTFYVRLASPSTSTVTVAWFTAEGTASAGTDFVPTNGFLTFDPGATLIAVEVLIVGDNVIEPDETFYVQLSNAANATITGYGSGIIRDDDTGRLSISDASVVEGDSGTTNCVFTLTLSKPLTNDNYPYYWLLSESAVPPVDYTSNAYGTVFMPAGTTNAILSIPVNGDTVNESNETFRVQVSPGHASAGRTTATGIIINDDAVPGRRDHFTWSTAAGTQYVGVPFAMTATARDYAGAIATNFNAAVPIAARSEFGIIPILMDDFEDGVLDQWSLPYPPQAIFLITNSSPTNLYSLRVQGSQSIQRAFPGAYPNELSFRARADHTNRIAGVVSLKLSYGYTPVEFFFGSNGVMGLGRFLYQSPIGTTYESNRWYDVRIAVHYGPNSGGMDLFIDGTQVVTNLPLLDSIYYGATTMTLGGGGGGAGSATLDNIKLLLDHVPIALPNTPMNPVFTNGVWSGDAMVLDVGTNVYLRADDGAQHTGDSSTFHVLVPPKLTLTIPPSATEGDGALTGSLQLEFPLARDVTAALTSSDISKATVSPATIVIPAGSVSAAFTIHIVDGPALDGSQSVNITATPPFLSPVTNSILVHDNETAVLGLSLPATAVEGSARYESGRVWFNSISSRDIAVTLTSMNTNQVKVPASVTIPAGQTSVVFDVRFPDDTAIDGTQRVSVVAHVQNWTDATAEVAVLDNDPLELTVLAPSPGEASEGDGTFSNPARVRITGTLTTNLTVTLASSDETELLVPPSATIPAGATEAPFPVTIVDDLLADGRQRVWITASTPGFSSGSNSMWVLDDEIDHFAFDAITNSITNAAPFTIRIRARDIIDTPVVRFNGAATLSVINSNGTPAEVTPTNVIFNNGVAFVSVNVLAGPELVRLTVTDSNGHIGQSDWFYVNERAVQFVNVGAITDLAFDANTRTIFVSSSNGLRSVDVPSGIVSPLVPVSRGVGKLAVSAGGQYLYGGLNGTSAVRRFHLPDITTDADIRLQPITGIATPGVLDIAASPSNALLFAVAQSNIITISVGSEGVRVYEGTKARPLASTNGANAITFGANDARLYEWNPVTAIASARLITSDGISNQIADSAYQNLVGGDIIQFSGGRVFPPYSYVLDAESMANIGFLAYSIPCVPDAVTRRIVSANNFIANSVRLVVSDQTTLVPIGSLEVTNTSYATRRLLRCGTNIIVFATTNRQIVIVRSPLFHPGPAADLSVRVRTCPSLVTTNDDILHVVTISNAGPNTAQASISSAAWLVSAVKPPTYFASRTIRVGTLAPGGATNFIYRSPSNAVGTVKEMFAVASSGDDPNLANNAITQVVAVVAGPPSGTNVFVLPLPANDVGWSPATSKLYVTPVPTSANDRLFVVDPISRTVVNQIQVTNLLSRLRVSSDGMRLQVNRANNSLFAEVNVFSATSGPPRSALGSFVHDFATLPGNTNALLVAGSSGVELYVDGQRQPDVGSLEVTSIAPVQNENAVWGTRFEMVRVNGVWENRPTLAKFAVASNGVTLVSHQASAEMHGRLQTFDGLLFDRASGTVLDPVNNRALAAFVFPGGDFLVDSEARRVFWIHWNGSGLNISAFDLFTHELLGMFSTPGPGLPGPGVYNTTYATLWGTDGIAVATGGALVLVRTSLRNDADGDGLPDSWETKYLGGISADANVDTDGDGASNYAEFIAGTNPADATSVLRVIATHAGEDTLTFPARAQLQFAIEWSAAVPATNWISLTNGITGTGTHWSVTLPIQTNINRFYRVRVSPPTPP